MRSLNTSNDERQTSLPVIIAIGYSVRSLVEACKLAGLESIAVDHFGDADTREFTRGRWIEFLLDDGDSLSGATFSAIQVMAADFLHARRAVYFLLAGGMENLGRVVEQLRSIAPVLGPTEFQRRALRSMDFLRVVAEAAGLKVPEVQNALHSAETAHEDMGSVTTGQWLWKPVHSAGGIKIVRSKHAQSDGEPGYWQAFIQGKQLGICCVLGSKGCEILGATRSFEGADWPGPTEFIYRGSYGPIRLAEKILEQIARLGHAIQARLGQTGWLQFDFIEDNDEQLWLLECNPRWTAGMEVLGYPSDANVICKHLQACGHSVSTFEAGPKHFTAYHAKAVVYAQCQTRLTQTEIQALNQCDWLSDRPFAPQTIACGHPIVTIRVELGPEAIMSSEAAARSQLLQSLAACAKRVQGIVESNSSGKAESGIERVEHNH